MSYLERAVRAGRPDRGGDRRQFRDRPRDGRSPSAAPAPGWCWSPARRAGRWPSAVAELAGARRARRRAVVRGPGRRGGARRPRSTRSRPGTADPDMLVNAAAVNRRPPMDRAHRRRLGRHARRQPDRAVPARAGVRAGDGGAAAGAGSSTSSRSRRSGRTATAAPTACPRPAWSALTRSQAEAWSPRGVCCNAIAPGRGAHPADRAGVRRPGEGRGARRADDDRAQRRTRGFRRLCRLSGECR